MTRPYLGKLLPLLVLAAGLAATYFLQQAAFNTSRQIQQDHFKNQSREIVLRIEQRLAAYEQILRGAKGLFVASKSVERDEFRNYIIHLRLEDHYPGIQGVGFSLIVPPQEKSRHIGAMRKEGFSGYTVWPEGERSIYTSIIYLEPFAGRNLRSLGYDMYSEATRRVAMERARDSNEAALSGMVRLVQETEQDVQTGFLMYLPVYRNGKPHETLADRRANIVGWVYAPFRMNDLMHGILGDQVNNADLEIYDGENATPETLMYDSNSIQRKTGEPLYDFSQCIKVVGHNWHIKLHSLPVFETNIDVARAATIRLTGMLVSLLLSLLVWLLASGRARALKLAQDMTHELRESEAMSHAIIEATPIPLALNDEHGNITYLNRAFIQTLGYTTSDIPTLADWWPRAYPDPQYRQWVIDSWQEKLKNAKRTSEPFLPIELNIRCKDGLERTFMVGAASIKESFSGTHLVILYDITERKDAEKELRTLSTAIEQSPLSVVITDLDANIQYVNPHFMMVTGYSREEALGQNPRILQSGLTSRASYDELWNALTSGQAWHGEFVNKRKNGEFYWEEVHIAPVMNSAGNPMHYVAVKLEITERKQAEEELLRSNAELEQFSYAVSHDMRQPLRMISSYLQLLERSLTEQLDGEKRDYFNFAIEGAKRIDQMLVDLLEYSRVGRTGEPLEWIDSRAVLDEALQFLQPAIAEAQAKLTVVGDWPHILASHNQILMLLQNLIVNAAKYRIAGRTPEITVTGEVVGKEWHLCVADNGVGIIPTQIKRLFQMFQRLHSREIYEGTGIGLALCRKITEHHKGRIWAESEGEGKGSRFYVVLPVLREK